LAAQLGKYAEALELIWLQYVVGYDKQEQRSLATSLHNQLFVYRRSFAQIVSAAREAITLRSGAIALIGLAGMAAFLLLFVIRRVRRFGWRRGLRLSRRQVDRDASTVVFYERLLALLALRGVKRDPDLTPLEFASGLDFQPALSITRAYNRVRFGGQELSPAELREIERALAEFEQANN
jgi:hypothetical protein